MEKKTIGSFIAVLRKAAGMTQRELAEKLNVSDKAVSRWERDETLPDLTLIPVLAELFGVTSDELLRGQRILREEPPEDRREKSAKRLQYLLDKATTDCRICTVIACLLAALGLVMAPIFVRLLDDPPLAFLMACIFLVGGVAVQLVGKVKGDSALAAEEFDSTALQQCHRSLLRQTMLGISANTGVFFISLALWTIVNVPPLTILMLAIAAWAVTSLAIYYCICRSKGYRDLLTAKTLLRLWAALVLLAALGGTTVGLMILQSCWWSFSRPQYFDRLIPLWLLLYLAELVTVLLLYRRKAARI